MIRWWRAARRDDRALVKLWMLATCALVAAALVTSCSAGARDKALRAAYVSAQASSTALTTYDAAHQADLVTAAPDRATGETALATWRERRHVAELAIGTLYRAIAAAAVINDDQSLQAMITAAGIVAQELAALGVKIGGGS
jgi:hypothetical protein